MMPFQETSHCKNCGSTVSLTDRFCGKCGDPVFISLDDSNINNHDFIEIYNSVYNLLSDKENPTRSRYYPKSSETIIFERGRSGFEEVWQGVSRTRAMMGQDPINFEISNLGLVYNSNMLSGYAFRLTEQLKTGSTTPPLENTELQKFLYSFLDKSEEGWIDKSEFTKDSLDNPKKKRIILIHALGWNDNYQKYLLLNKKEFDDLAESLLDDRIKTSFNILDHTPDFDISGGIRDGIADEVVTDFLYGYTVRLSEELYPLE